jgi:hypothetical protein
MPPSKCVVLVPVTGHIEPACEDSLRELEQQGYPVRQVRGFAAIDQGCCQMAGYALVPAFDTASATACHCRGPM